MKKLLFAAAAVSLLAIAAPAAAEGYGNLGYSQADIDPVKLGAVTGRLGWTNGGWWGVEGEASIGVNDDTVAGVDFDLKSDFAAYVVATAPINEQFNLFARLGYGTTRVEVTPGGDDSASGLAYGVGANWFFDDANGARIDYTRRDTEDDFGDDIDVWSISYVRRFR